MGSGSVGFLSLHRGILELNQVKLPYNDDYMGWVTGWLGYHNRHVDISCAWSFWFQQSQRYGTCPWLGVVGVHIHDGTWAFGLGSINCLR